jgi:V/A-type H+-transporting ATPase subunit B
MRLEYIGASEVSGSLVALQNVRGVSYDELAEVTLQGGERRYGRVILIDGDRVVLQAFEGTAGISLENASTHFTGKPMDMALSREMLGRVFDGAGRPIDGWGSSIPDERRDINGAADQPREPALSPQLHQHRHLRHRRHRHPDPRPEAADLLRRRHEAQRAGGPDRGRPRSDAERSDFAIVFAAMGVKNDVADFFREL